MGAVTRSSLSTGNNIFPYSINFSCLMSSYSSTGSVATNCDISFGFKPTGATSGKRYLDETGHYVFHIGKTGSTVTVRVNGQNPYNYAGTIGSTYAAFVQNVLTDLCGTYAGYFSYLNIIESNPGYDSFGGFANKVTNLWAMVSQSGMHTTLDFSNSGDLGSDSSGSGNDWVVTGTQYEDSPTDNACVLNALDPNAGTLSNGNLTLASGTAKPTLQPETGKWSYKKGGVEQLYDADSSGKFEPDLTADTYIFTGYTPTSGYKLITASNLPDPTVLKSEEYVYLATFTAPTGADQDITIPWDAETNDWGMRLKNRGTEDWAYISTVVGLQYVVKGTNTTKGRETLSTAMTASGSTITIPDDLLTDSNNYIVEFYRVSPTSGFDIQTYSGTGVAKTVAHDNGVAPFYVLVMPNDTTARNHPLGFEAIGWTKYLLRNSTAVAAPSSAYWNDTAPTSTDVTVGTSADVNASTADYQMWVWSESDIYKQLEYTGNASTDGPFDNLGGRLLGLSMMRNTDAVHSLYMWDAERSPDNPIDRILFPDNSVAESASFSPANFMSVGHKIVDASAGWNGSGNLHVGLAILESTSKYCNPY